MKIRIIWIGFAVVNQAASLAAIEVKITLIAAVEWDCSLPYYLLFIIIHLGKGDLWCDCIRIASGTFHLTIDSIK